MIEVVIRKTDGPSRPMRQLRALTIRNLDDHEDHPFQGNYAVEAEDGTRFMVTNFSRAEGPEALVAQALAIYHRVRADHLGYEERVEAEARRLRGDQGVKSTRGVGL